MKTLLSILILIPSFSICLELSPLNQVIQERDMNDKTTYLYLTHRCAGLFFLNAKRLEDTHPELVDELTIKTEILLQASKLFNKGFGTLSDEELTQIAAQEAKKYFDIYYALFEKNWYEKGSLFEGTWVENDVILCHELYNELLAGIKN